MVRHEFSVIRYCILFVNDLWYFEMSKSILPSLKEKDYRKIIIQLYGKEAWQEYVQLIRLKQKKYNLTRKEIWNDFILHLWWVIPSITTAIT